MALNASGAISLGGSTTGESIALELGLSATGAISLNDTTVRDLAGIASGAIVMPSDFWGKSSIISGELRYIGDNSFGISGNNTRTSIGSTLTLGGGSKDDWVAIAHGGVKSDGPHALGIDDSGRLWAWGRGNKGQLGNNIDYRNESSPVQIGSATNWESVSTARWNTDAGNSAAVKSNGDGYTWGDNQFQQTNSYNRIDSAGSQPTRIGTGNIYQTYNTQISSISKIFLTSGRNGFVLKNNGTMYGAGRNQYGSCGVNYSYSNVGFEPLQSGNSDYVEAAASSDTDSTSFFLRSGGQLEAAGREVHGALGNGAGNTYIGRSSPVSVLGSDYKTVRGTEQGGIAIKNNGTLWAWGRNNQGECGQGNRVSYSSPVQIGSLTTWDKFFQDECHEDVTGIIKTDGTIWCLGKAREIDQASSGSTFYSSPVQILSSVTGAYTISMVSNSGGAGGTFFLTEA